MTINVAALFIPLKHFNMLSISDKTKTIEAMQAEWETGRVVVIIII